MKKMERIFDLKGITAISKHTGKTMFQLLDWHKVLDFPIHRYCDRQSFGWQASSSEIEQWCRARGINLKADDIQVVKRKAQRFTMVEAIKAGTRGSVHGQKVCRNDEDISRLFHLTGAKVFELRQSSDFPVPKDLKKYEIKADLLQDYFDLNGVETGTHAGII